MLEGNFSIPFYSRHASWGCLCFLHTVPRKMKMNCTNCNQSLEDQTNFCPACGQSTRSIDRGFWVVMREQMHELLDIDGRLALSIKTLLTEPGKMTREYIEGRRMQYTPPLRLYLSISILFFLLFSYIYPIYSSEQNASSSLSDYYAKAMFVLFPIYAILIQVFYSSSRFLGNLVFSLHIHSLVYLVLMVISLLEANESKHVILLWLQVPPTLYLFWYIIQSFKTVFEQNWFWTIAKSGAIFFIYMAMLGVAFDVVLEQVI